MCVCAKRTTASGWPATVELRAADDKLLATDHTRAGTADMNDMPDFTLPENAASVTFRFVRDGEAREKSRALRRVHELAHAGFCLERTCAGATGVLAAETWLAKPAGERGAPPDFTFTRDEAPRLISLAWDDVAKTRAESATEELSAKRIVIGDKALKWMEKTFGDAPDGKHSLWITLHGGGQGTEEENDANWKGYFGRYEFPPGSINVAPRAPANTWDMWHVRVGGRLVRPPDRRHGVAARRGSEPRLSDRLLGGWRRRLSTCAPRWPTALPPPRCARGIRTKPRRKGCATCRSSFTWAARMTLTTATPSCASSARKWMLCKPPIRKATCIG